MTTPEREFDLAEYLRIMREEGPIEANGYLRETGRTSLNTEERRKVAAEQRRIEQEAKTRENLARYTDLGRRESDIRWPTATDAARGLTPGGRVGTNLSVFNRGAAAQRVSDAAEMSRVEREALRRNVANPTPGVQALNNGLRPEGRAAIQSELARSFDDPDGLYVPWLSEEYLTEKDILGRTATTDSQATYLAEQYKDARRSGKLKYPTASGLPPTPEEEQKIREQYEKDHAKWEERKRKAQEQGREFTDAEPRLVLEPQIEAESPTELIRSATAVKGMFMGLSERVKKELADRLIEVGRLEEGNFDMLDLKAEWDKLVDLAANERQTNMDSLLTPFDMIDRWYRGKGIGGTEGGPKVTDVINKVATISTNAQARAMLRSVMARELGRRPTRQEVDDFQAALNEAQRANPSVEHSKRKYDRFGNTVGEDSTVTLGLDEDAYTDEYVMDNDPDSEYGRYQQATTYYNALIQAISGPAPQVRGL